ncbi:MAG: hypothetical protein ACJAX3_002369 [Patiriisocius sp.]
MIIGSNTTLIFLIQMGVDLGKFPSKDELKDMLSKQIKNTITKKNRAL